MKHAIFPLLFVGGCGLMTSDRIPGLLAVSPPAACEYQLMSIGGPTTCICILGARTQDGAPAVVMFEVADEKPCLDAAMGAEP